MSVSKSFSSIKTRSKTRKAQEELQDVSERLSVSIKSDKSNNHSAKSHATNTSVGRSRDGLEALNELIQIQEEETSMVISSAKAKEEKICAEAEAEAKIARAEAKIARAEAEMASKVAKAKAEAKFSEVEAKKMELQLKKRLIEERLSSSSRASSGRSSKLSSKNSLLSQCLPNKESIVKWMQQGEGNMHNSLKFQDDQPDFYPRDDGGESPRDLKTEILTKNKEEKQSTREVMNFPRDIGFPSQCPFADHKYSLPRDTKGKVKSLPTGINRTGEKMTARVLSALPIFSGELDQWPAWIAEFKRSTDMYDYTDLENLQRLQKSLTGRAKEMVSALLIYPENTPEIIDLLERRFGRPDVIIKSLISSVKNRPPTKDYKPDTLIAFSDMVRNLVVTVKSLKQDHYLLNPQLLEELTDKLSTNMKLNWGMFVTSQKPQLIKPIGLDNFSLWLSSIAEAATVCGPRIEQLPGTIKNMPRSDYNQKNFVLLQEDGEGKLAKQFCLCCKMSDHRLADCKRFSALEVQKRWELVKKYSVCFNCLKTKHRATKCRRKIPCGINSCTHFHHSLLHTVNKQNSNFNKEKKESDESQSEHVGYQEETAARVLLRVLSVNLVGVNGKMINTFALIDDGSTISVIESTLAEELGLDGPTIPTSFSWTDGSICTEESSKTVSITISTDAGEQIVMDNVKTLHNLQLPTQSINMNRMKAKWSHLLNIPEEAFNRGRPRLLIGHEHVHFTVPNQVVLGPANSPIALKSKLGWTVDGPVGRNRFHNQVDYIMFKSEKETQMDDLNSLVKTSFERDFIDCPGARRTKSEEEVTAETILEQTCKQTHDGRWQVGLLWREQNPMLPESRSLAWRRLKFINNKLEDNPEMKKQYYQQMKCYNEKGYARKLRGEEVRKKSEKTWYLPHFPVHNPKKPNKFRFVFDAASKSYGRSLNSYLLSGPNLFNNLLSILFHYRKHNIAFVADIEEMFLRIKIRSEDQDALRFLWQGDKRVVEEWCMTSLIFGSVCSPTSAIYVTRKNAEKHGGNCKQAVQAIKKQFYMDDYLDSKDTLEEAVRVVENVIDICSKGGFNLRNFISNSTELMDTIPKEKWSKNYVNQVVNLSDEGNTERVLGLHWDFHKDIFFFRINFEKVKNEVVDLMEPPTKRQVLQAVMSVYDPLGFITPITMQGKIILQELWRLNVRWDEPVPSSIENLWKKWMAEIKNSENLQIPRCYGMSSTACSIQLHVFCDASEKGFSAVAYFRLEKQLKVELAFVLAKSRVAPLHSTTIPRLELQAAVLGSRIANVILEYHDIIVSKTYFWIDSRIVWCWLQSTQNQKSVYVSNRVNEILETTKRNQWRWLRTTDNVADDATRGSTVMSDSNCRWLQGPTFLREGEETWPKIESKSIGFEKEEITLLNTTKEEHQAIIEMNRFSKYLRLIRSVAWVLRFIYNSQRRKERRNPNMSLSVEELKQAEEVCFKFSQQESFAEDLKSLREGKPLPRESKLSKLSPVVVKDILKMKGRLEYGNQVSQDMKNPIILDPKQRLTILLIQNEHEQAAHQGQETVANNLRQRFWILRLKQAIKSCWANCKKCQLRRIMPKTPEMAPLPAYRLEPYGRPFTCVALDYFGPLEITIGRRREKRYGALFTCLSVRAIHLELVATLNTDSAILAIRRFASRRGYPKELISDNGTNFKAAEKELKNALKTLNQEELKTFCACEEMKWSFLPPATPHMGGAHERLVQSAKKCLYTILLSQAPREETLTTLLCEVEYIINNRPLYPVSEDPADELPLTPNHFLLGGAHKLAPAIMIKEKHLLKQWKLSQDYADKFWKRWQHEYVPLLNKRSKWHSKQDNLAVGDLVLIFSSESRGNWSKGLVQNIYPGRDGQVRVVDVRTTTGILKRPVSKLVKLIKD